MSSGKRFFLRAASLLVASLAWGNGIMLAVYKVQLRMPTRHVDLLPTFQFMFGRSPGFVIDGLLWMSVGTFLVVYVFRRTSVSDEIRATNADET